MSAPQNHAVFLSYASEDAEAAKRICEALRAAGVEVWLDQDGGLVGGDAWDAKIRKQIKECALFVPIISANTQARAEGYFRLEWRLADQRTHLLGKSKALLLPVCIDHTRDSDADVPDSFLTVQWMRLKGGETNSALCERVKALLDGNAGLRAPSPAPSSDANEAPAHLIKPRRSRWMAPVFVGVAVMVALALALWPPWRKPGGSAPTAGAASSAVPAEAQLLVTKAWELLNRPELYRAELEVADGYCKRATTLSQDYADAWATWSQVDTWYLYHKIDRSPERMEGARTKAARALSIDPKSFEARFAEACYLVRAHRGSSGGQRAEFYASAEATLNSLLRERLKEPRVCFALGILLRNAGRNHEAHAAFDRMAETPSFAAVAWSEKGYLELIQANYAAAEEAADRSIALQSYFGNLLLRLYIATEWKGDLNLAKTTTEAFSPAILQEDPAVCNIARLFWWRREPEQMLRVIQRAPRPWFGWAQSTRGYVVGIAQRMNGAEEAARVSWTEAVKVVDERLAGQREAAALHLHRAELLGLLGRRDEALAALKLARGFGATANLDTAVVELLAGNRSAALADLERDYAEESSGLTAAQLRLEPRLDPLRDEPGFQALLARAEADPKRSPRAKATAKQ